LYQITVYIITSSHILLLQPKIYIGDDVAANAGEVAGGNVGRSAVSCVSWTTASQWTKDQSTNSFSSSSIFVISVSVVIIRALDIAVSTTTGRLD
jgi:hypothetical protein